MIIKKQGWVVTSPYYYGVEFFEDKPVLDHDDVWLGDGMLIACDECINFDNEKAYRASLELVVEDL